MDDGVCFREQTGPRLLTLNSSLHAHLGSRYSPKADFVVRKANIVLARAII